VQGCKRPMEPGWYEESNRIYVVGGKLRRTVGSGVGRILPFCHLTRQNGSIESGSAEFGTLCRWATLHWALKFRLTFFSCFLHRSSTESSTLKPHYLLIGEDTRPYMLAYVT
jgi:hypothetical protein